MAYKRSPGKFESSGAVGELFNAIMLEGFSDDSISDDNGGGGADLFYGPFDLKKFAEGWPAEVKQLNSVDRAEIATSAGVIVFTDSQGFVDVNPYDSVKSLESAWESVRASYRDAEDMEIAPGSGNYEANAKKKSEAEKFFFKQAGYSYSAGANKAEQDKARRANAQALAHAEAVAYERGWEFVWEEDPSGMDTLGDVPAEDVTEILQVLLKDENGEVLESLGGVSMGYDSQLNRNMVRLVEAEMASEALHKAGHQPNARARGAARGEREKMASFGIWIHSQDVIEENARESFGPEYGDPEARREALAAGYVDTEGNITDKGWKVLNEDVLKLERNALNWLKQKFESAIDDGHADDELVGRLWYDPDNTEQVELLRIGVDERIDMSDASYGDLANSVWNGTSDFASVLGGQIKFEGVEFEENSSRRAMSKYRATSVQYAPSASGQYILSHDGKEIMRGTEQELWAHIHRHHSYSIEHALRYEGYKITPADTMLRNALDTDALASDIYQYIHRIGPYAGIRGYPTPFEISKKYKLPIVLVQQMDFVHTQSAGPGGKGEAWAKREIARLLKKRGQYAPLESGLRPNARRRGSPGAEPDPKVYLSKSEGRYRVIQQGVPIGRDETSASAALAVAEHYKLQVSDRMWNGDTGTWEPLTTVPNARPGALDEQAAHELELYLDNDARFSMDAPTGIGRDVLRNMMKKYRSGKYDPRLAVKGWLYVVDAAAKQYAKENSSPGSVSYTFTPATRQHVASEMADEFLRRAKAGEFDHVS